VPILCHSVLFGVLKVVNGLNLQGFTDFDHSNILNIANILGQKFLYEFRGTRGPYEFLVQTKQITRQQLNEYQKRAIQENTSITKLLLLEAHLSNKEIGASLSRYYQVPYLGYDPLIVVPRELLQGLNIPYLKTNCWVPIRGNSKEVTILIEDPTDVARILEIRRVIRADKHVFNVALREDVLQYLGHQRPIKKAALKLPTLVAKLHEESAVQEATPAPHMNMQQEQTDDSTVAQFVNALFLQAFKLGASDIHIQPRRAEEPTKVRFRIDGICQPLLSIPDTHALRVISRIKILSGMDITEHRQPQDGKCLVCLEGNRLEMRVASIPTVNGESLVIRMLPTTRPLPIDELGFSSRNEREIKNVMYRPHGIFLAVGPTGSGKTTTLHSLLAHINTPELKIWTVEDPVEITQPGLEQVQVHPKIGLDFAKALRSFLRGDPDVIMIGEIRDQETAQSAFEASLTGHLVFSSMHTNSAAETLVRLLDLGVDSGQVSSGLLGVLAQRLVRTLCGDCKQSYLAGDLEYDMLVKYYGAEYFEELAFLNPALDIKKGELRLYQAMGCDSCAGTGYRGRVAIHELLVVNQDIKHLIHSATAPSVIEAAAIKTGMRTLLQDGISKVCLGLTDLAQVTRIAAKPV